MSTNGQRRPPRPRIEILSASASPEEAAAIAAAIEQFLADTAPPAVRAEKQNAWQRAALLEGPLAKRAVADALGEATPWGALHR